MNMDIINVLTQYQMYSYSFILIILIACGFGLPLPEDIVLIVSGIFIANHVTNFPLTILICMLGVLGGDSIIFFIGKIFGPKLLSNEIFKKIIKPRNIAKVRLLSAKYGNYLIFFARFMPGFRSPVFFSMGMFKKSYSIFFSIDGFAALISVPLWIYIGYLFGSNLSILENKIKNMQYGLYVTLAVVVLVIWGSHKFKKKISNRLEKNA